MKHSSEQYFLEVIAGTRRGAAAEGLRAALRALEIPYSAMMRARNGLYNRGLLPIHRLPRATVSVGNLTTGGTGKTPLVCWLAASLQEAEMKPAVLLRGYKSGGGTSDEQLLISQAAPRAVVIANPNRMLGAAAALAERPDIDLFILDDAMQHRRVGRDVDIVVISAASPWGYHHALPRGLLRESVAGIIRADAIVITHAAEASKEELTDIENMARRYNSVAPIYMADHAVVGFLAGESELPAASLREIAYFVACGIGQPHGFVASLQSLGAMRVGHHFFPDHHHFTSEDIRMLREEAVKLGAAAIVVTEKDWTKLASIETMDEVGLPFWRARLKLLFRGDGENELLELIRRRIGR